MNNISNDSKNTKQNLGKPKNIAENKRKTKQKLMKTNEEPRKNKRKPMFPYLSLINWLLISP